MRVRLGRMVLAGVTAMLLGMPAAGQAQTRDVMLVGNNHGGTVTVLDARTFEQLGGEIDVAPDYQSCLSGPSSPDQSVACTLNNQLAAEGEPQLVDDLAVSPDGGVLYVSRPSMADAAAFDLRTRRMLPGWPVEVSGFVGTMGRRSDHMALSPDGRRLLVSATTANVVDVIDTERAEIVHRIPAGDFPHENRYTDDGELIFNGSIGRVITPDNPELDAAKGDRILTIADADTLEVRKQIDFGRGIRPFVVMPDNRTMYVQLSFLNGLVEYDVVEERPLRTLHLPLAGGATEDDDFLDSAHHGLAISGDRRRLCAAGTVSDYVAIIRRESLTVQRIIPVGDLPYWAATTPDGRFCLVPNARDNDVSVISYRHAKEVARVPVGDFPQRIRAASLPADVLANEDAER